MPKHQYLRTMASIMPNTNSQQQCQNTLPAVRDLPNCEVPEEGELEHMKAFSPGLLFALMTVIEITAYQL